MISREQAERLFEDFLMVMDDQLDWLHEEASKYGICLSTDMGDCEKLEVLFDKMSVALSANQIQDLSWLLSRQLGEIVRRTHGGKWALSWNEENTINQGLPVIIGHCPIGGIEFAPTRTMHFYALRRIRGLLRRSIEADVRPSPLEIRSAEE